MLRLNIILRCFETSSIFFITENRFIQIYTYTTNIKNITNINVEKNFFNFRNFNLKLKYKMRKINEMVPSYKLEFQIFFETFQKKKKMGQSFCFLRSFVLLRQARAKRIVSFLPSEKQKSGFPSTCKRDFMRWLFMPFACKYVRAFAHLRCSFIQGKRYKYACALRTRAHTPTMRNDHITSPTLLRSLPLYHHSPTLPSIAISSSSPSPLGSLLFIYGIHFEIQFCLRILLVPPFICLFVLYLFTSLPFSSFFPFLISLSSFFTSSLNARYSVNARITRSMYTVGR